MNKNVHNEDIKRNLKSYWNKWNWEVYCVLNVPEVFVPTVEYWVEHWLQQMSADEKVEIGCVGIIKQFVEPHVELLMLSDHSRGKFLADIKVGKWKSEWYRMSESTAAITQVYDQTRLVSFVVGRNTRPGSYELINPYNNELLLKMKVVKGPPKLAA